MRELITLCPILYMSFYFDKFVRTRVRDNLLTDGHFREICCGCTHIYAWALKLHVLVEVKNALVKLVRYIKEDLARDGRCSKVILHSTISASYPIMLHVTGPWMDVWKANNVRLNVLCKESCLFCNCTRILRVRHWVTFYCKV